MDATRAKWRSKNFCMRLSYQRTLHVTGLTAGGFETCAIIPCRVPRPSSGAGRSGKIDKRFRFLTFRPWPAAAAAAAAADALRDSP